MRLKRIILLSCTLLLLVGSVSAKAIRGSVKVDGKGIEGVLVTDGYSFSSTDAAGAFEINTSRKARHITVVSPAQYEVAVKDDVPSNWLEIKGKKDDYTFNLSSIEATAPGAYVVALADPQMQNDKHWKRYVKYAEQPLKEKIEALKSTGKRVVGITLGDICWDQFDYMDAYQASVAAMDIPFYGVIGNHDYNYKAKGDKATAKKYEAKYGSPDYIFVVEDTHYIVLDNIDYDTAKKYTWGVTDAQVQWVEKYMELIDDDAPIIFAQHVPPHCAGITMENFDELLLAVAGHPVSFMTGHTHISQNLEVAPGIIEHNVNAICGAWWIVNHGTDGTPIGGRVFEHEGRQTSNYYFSFEHGNDCQMQLYGLNQHYSKPNSVVAKVWNVHPDWSVVWWQDGKEMGEMKRFTSYDPTYLKHIHQNFTLKKKTLPLYKSPVKTDCYFEATPSVDAKRVKVVVTDSVGRVWEQEIELNHIDIHAHRGGIGLMPENTIEAMKNAMDLGVNYLELDLNISKDGRVVVSHDPYMNPKIALTPEGEEIADEDKWDYALYSMDYDEIRRYDVGSKYYEEYPEQQKMECYKPLASELIDSMEAYALRMGYSAPRYNIEIKSSKSRDGKYSPVYTEFVDMAMKVLNSKGLGERLLIQSFDTRALNYLHENYPGQTLSYLVDSKYKDLVGALDRIEFTPEWCSPHYTLLTPEVVEQFKEMGIKLAPWTVDTVEDLQSMVDMNVEAIITNYPDRLIEILRQYKNKK